jgi:hypothetical protein
MAHQGQITQHDNCCTDKQGMWSDNGSVKDDLSGDVLLNLKAVSVAKIYR